MNKPIISFLMNARIRTDLNNKNSKDIIKFFEKAEEKIYKEDRDDVEFLVKCDDDDIKMREIRDKVLKFPFKIKMIFYRRWEGIYTEHLNYTYLLTRVNPNSKFIGFVSDDAEMEHMSIGNLAKFKENIEDNYIFYTNRLRMDRSNKEYQEFLNYRNFNVYDQFRNKLVEPYPIVSKKILQITSGCGLYHTIDSWLALISYILITKYSISILKNFPCQTFIRMNNQTSDMIEEPIISSYNSDIEKMDSYYDFVEQQTKNIYLNMLSDGVVEKYK